MGLSFLSAQDAKDIVLRRGDAVGLKNAAEEEIQLARDHEDVEVQFLGVV